MSFRRVVAFTLVLGQLLVVPASADTVVLLSGERYEGTLANRELVVSDPGGRSTVALLMSGEERLLRFRIEEIDHVVVVDGIASQVIDFVDICTSVINRVAVAHAAPPERSASGVPSIVVGVLIGGTGAFMKRGETYASVNYVMMGSGVLLVVLGIVSELVRPRYADSQRMRVGLGPSFSPSGDAMAVALQWEF